MSTIISFKVFLHLLFPFFYFSLQIQRFFLQQIELDAPVVHLFLTVVQRHDCEFQFFPDLTLDVVVILRVNYLINEYFYNSWTLWFAISPGLPTEKFSPHCVPFAEWTFSAWPTFQYVSPCFLTVSNAYYVVCFWKRPVLSPYSAVCLLLLEA